MILAQQEGTVVFMRSEGPSAERCACCEGAHMFGRRIADASGTGINWNDFWWNAIRDAKLEGKKVRMTLEVVE